MVIIYSPVVLQAVLQREQVTLSAIPVNDPSYGHTVTGQYVIPEDYKIGHLDNDISSSLLKASVNNINHYIKAIRETPPISIESQKFLSNLMGILSSHYNKQLETKKMVTIDNLEERWKSKIAH